MNYPNEKASPQELRALEWLRTLSPEEVDALVAEEERDARAASEDIEAFFEYVMREQTTRSRVKCLPHQRVALSFIMHHDRSVNMLPIGHAKTFSSAALTLFLLGRDPTLRGAIVSATQEQAQKTLGVVADYVLHSAPLRRVFPELRKSERLRDPWTQTKITVKRPPGIPDASLYAVGIDGGLPGARLNWIVVDDILNRENTATKASRDKVYEWFDSTVMSRLDPVGAKVVVTNTTWHPDDLVHVLEKRGWPTLRMDVLGNVKVQDDALWMREGRAPWDHPELRPASPSPREDCYRLRGNDPDPGNEKTLWPAKFPRSHVDGELRSRHLPSEFARLYLLTCRDDDTAMCKREYVELCMRKAREKGVFSLTGKYTGDNPTFTGVDLAFGLGEEHDETALFTFESWPDGHRRILDIDVGRWPVHVVLDKIVQKQKDYNSVVRVESNAGQDAIRQVLLQLDKSLPIKGHMTGRAKAHPEHGIPGIFLELSNGAWLLPNDVHGNVHPAVQGFIDACLYYSPSKHTPDVLMAAYLAREQARAWGMLQPTPKGAVDGSLQMGVLQR